MATFHQQGQKVENQFNITDEPTKKTTVNVYGQTAVNMRALSAKRKDERNPIKTIESIVDQLINQAYKKECK